jgi:hypothetical protein
MRIHASTTVMGAAGFRDASDGEHAATAVNPQHDSPAIPTQRRKYHAFRS